MGREQVVWTSDGQSLWSSVDGSGPPMLLCHGGPGLWDYLGGLARDLGDDFTVHRWDQRGCGRSGPAPAYTLDVALRDVQELRAAWKVEDRWTVVGHSWGAYLALLTAIRHPESTSAVVYVSGTGSPSWWRNVGSARYRTERARRLTPDAQARLVELSGTDRSASEEVEFRRLSWMTDFAQYRSPPVDLEEMASTDLPINWELNRSLGRAELGDEQWLLEACAYCTVPCLFVHGVDDPRSGEGARLLADRLPDARFVELEDAGHHPWVERPRGTTEAIREFLHRVL